VAAEIAKKTHTYYLLVLSASQRVNFEKVKSFVGAKSVRMAPAPKAQELTGCVMGAVPPFSFNSDLKMIVDPFILSDQAMEMAFNAGRLDRSIFLKVSDYIAIANPQVQSIS
jgi:Ala-tRNA(Pro) deacylase